jgi:hypothetical protein
MTALNYAATAIRRNKPSAPLKKFLEHLPKLKRLIGQGTVPSEFFDYGCGKGDDIEYLKSQGYSVIGYDAHIPKHENKQIYKYSGRFNIVTLFYVLNVLPSEMSRRSILLQIRRCLGTYGIVAVATRTPKEVSSACKDTWEPMEDGWLTPGNTFQCGFTPKEVASMLMDAGWGITIKLNQSDYTLVVGLDSLTILEV